MAQYFSNSESKIVVIMRELYIGLMSGTSLDGIDVVLMAFDDTQTKLLATHYVPYETSLREQIFSLCQPGFHELERLGELDVWLAKEFANAINALLMKEKLLPSQIKAIGSHGQTIRHYPNNTHPFTLQIADPNTIATLTGITTIADFRRKDIASGGQGAPLVPAFHQYLLQKYDDVDRAVVNIGGIANVTLLTKQKSAVIGFDTGPGNLLMDAWVSLYQQKRQDIDGNWAASGKICDSLLKNFLDDPYFALSSPKSTGREYFNLQWLKKFQAVKEIAPEDVQATLAELTVQSIVQSIEAFIPAGEIVVCGGGANNGYLMKRLQQISANSFAVTTTEKYGIHPDWVEASAFAWLAYQTMHHQTGNLPFVTGAKKAVILGGIYHPN